MDKEEQKWELAEVEEQEEEEHSQLVRKSKAGNASKDLEIAAVSVEVSNGVSESNGLGIHSNGDENGAKNEESTLEEEQNIEELDAIFENKTEAKNGEQKIEELDGVSENGSEATNGEQKIEELDGVPENDLETINWEQKIEDPNGFPENGFEAISGEHKSTNLVFYDKAEGIESPEFGVQNLQTNSTSAINGGDLKNNTLSSSSLHPSQISDQEHNSSYIKSSNEIESAEVESGDLINEDDVDETDYDVEKVIQKQNTHDLYCPNCNSCITRRVILRKRKRKIRITDEEAKRNKIETGVSFKVGSGSVHEPSGEVHHADEVDFADTEIRREDDEERSKGPAIFKCLSCFSIFIPTRKGFQVLFGDKSGKETAPVEQVPRVNKNWFISLFASNKQDTAVVQGSSSQTNVQKSDVVVWQSSNLGNQSGQPSLIQKARSPTEASEGEDNGVPFPRPELSLNGKVIIGGGDKLNTTTTEKRDATMELFESYTGDQFEESKPGKEVENGYSVIAPPKRSQVTNGESSEDSTSFTKQDGLKFSISSNKGSAVKGPILDGADVDGKVNVSVAIPYQEQDVRATISTDSVVENKYSNFKSSKSGRFYPTEMSQHTVTETKFELHSGEPLQVDNVSAVNAAVLAQDAGKDAVITIDAQPDEPSLPVQSSIHPTESATPLLSGTQEGVETRKEFEIEVVKSIVYGGLAECITSLSVVSSAAGGGAATLNILALGMANLIGGLFIVCHNLWELKSDRVEEVSNQISDQAPKQRDRYKQLLGRRENFILHAVVAIISYIIFGLVPPLVYGFSFRKTDDKELKLLVVAASSLLCILFLAVGRAYVRRPPKPYLQSVTTFVVLGFMVSGVSYAAGILVERLLEKLGFFESGSVSNLLLSEMVKEGSGWASL